MKELIEDEFYNILANEYSELDLDYVLLSFDEEYHGKESHKKAVSEAISIFNTREKVCGFYYEKESQNKRPKFFVEEEKMIGKKCNIKDFFHYGDRIITLFRKLILRVPMYHSRYCNVFLCLPYGHPYTEKDFHKINRILFPIKYRKDLEIYCWDGDFTNYFYEIKPLYSAALWSIYDKHMKRFIIIGYCLTD